MKLAHLKSGSSLSIQATLTKVKFAKEGKYFVVLQLADQEKLRTNISEVTATPKFDPSAFDLSYFHNGSDSPSPILTMGAFLIPTATGEDNISSNEAALLGSASIDIEKYINKPEKTIAVEFVQHIAYGLSAEVATFGSASLSILVQTVVDVPGMPPSLAECNSPIRSNTKKRAQPFGSSANNGLIYVYILSAYNLSKLVPINPSQEIFLVAHLRPYSSQEGPLFSTAIDQEEYLESYSQFSYTRPVEMVECPCWNELLVASMDSFEELSSVDKLDLRLDFIVRDSFSEKDFLIAQIILPLVQLKPNHTYPFSLSLSPDLKGADPAASLFLTIFQNTNPFSNAHDMPPHRHGSRIELTIENIPDMDLSMSTGFSYLVGAQFLTINEAAQKAKDIEQHLAEIPCISLVKEEMTAQALEPALLQFSVRGSTGISPLSSLIDNCIVWRFPILFDDFSDEDTITDVAVLFSLYKYNIDEIVDLNIQRVPDLFTLAGYGILDLSDHMCENTSNGIKLYPDAIPLKMLNDNKVCMLHTSLRIWNSNSLFKFLSNEKRTLRTNRKPTSSIVEWIGPIIRGLRRNQLSSIIDRCGISGILASDLDEELESNGDDGIQMFSKSNSDSETHFSTGNNAMAKTLIEKENLIQRLLSEVDRRTDAIKCCGQEIIDLRNQKLELEKKNEELKNELEYSSSSHLKQDENSPFVLPDNFSSSDDNDSLVKFAEEYSILKNRYNDLAAHNKDLIERSEKLLKQEKILNEMKDSFSKLKKAHVVQAKYIQKLQKDQQRISVFKSTIKTQEKIINKLENVIETKLQQTRDGPPSSNVHVELHRLRQENNKLTKKLSQENSSPSDVTGTVDASRIRIKVLEEQLEINARDASLEISDLKMRLFELEMGLTESPATKGNY